MSSSNGWIGILDDESEGMQDILLSDADFPRNYVNWAHPDDYIPIDKPFKPEYTYHHSTSYKHYRLLMRVCFELSESKKFLPMSFVLDTGLPKPLYLSEKAMSIFTSNGLLKLDKKMQLQYIKIYDRNYVVEPIPYQHRWANLMGLPLLMKMGLVLREVDGVETFKLSSMPLDCFTSTSLKFHE
jgi:hypothetical protein